MRTFNASLGMRRRVDIAIWGEKRYISQKENCHEGRDVSRHFLEINAPREMAEVL